MATASLDPGGFLRHQPPFDRLDEESFEAVEAALEVEFAPRGSAVLRRDGPENRHLYVVRKGVVRLEADGRVLEHVEEGEPFGFPSLLAGASPHVDVVADEDVLLLKIGKRAFERAMSVASFADYFQKGLRERLRSAVAAGAPETTADLAVPAASLLHRPAEWTEGDAPVGEAARRMRDLRVSSLLLRTTPPSIVTDRDLRNRVLAPGLPATTPVTEVASQPMVTLDAGATVFEAMAKMLERRIHHLPLVRGEETVGVLTDTDLLRYHLRSPFHLRKQLENADVQPGGYDEQVTGMVASMIAGGADPLQVGRVVASLNDTLVARLLAAAEERLGPPPTPYAWIVFGSEGRLEQALLTDQDNAIVFRDGTDEAERWAAGLAEEVVEELVRAGFPRCRGDYMATRWRGSLDWWRDEFRSWTDEPEPEALLRAANFFDFRRVGGTLDLSPLDQQLLRAGRRPAFLAHLARAALRFRPPVGLFRQIRDDDGGVDVKRGGLLPIVGMARVWALEAGSLARGTVERLREAARVGPVSGEGAGLLEEAFRFLFRLRLRAQLDAARDGRPITNRIDLDRIDGTDRRHLKESFGVIRTMQDAMAHRFGVGLLG